MSIRLIGALLCGAGFAFITTGAAAMPLAHPAQFPISNVESVALVCGPNGCIRTRPVIRSGYGVRRGYGYGVRRGGYAYGVRRGYRR